MNKKLRVLVCGGRDFQNSDWLFAVLDAIAAKCQVVCIIHGAASGADTLAKEWAEKRGISAEPYPALWDDLTTRPLFIKRNRHGKPYNAAAGGIRNQRMLTEGKPNLIVAFPGGSGTGDMMKRARAAGFREIPGEVTFFYEKGFDFF